MIRHSLDPFRRRTGEDTQRVRMLTFSMFSYFHVFSSFEVSPRVGTEVADTGHHEPSICQMRGTGHVDHKHSTSVCKTTEYVDRNHGPRTLVAASEMPPFTHVRMIVHPFNRKRYRSRKRTKIPIQYKDTRES